ncbi:ankyrin repeat and SAM domain-containing protein 1A [Elysia marginata]|uniref:Ankyrin repeat and SAM domain-containing protein 1A n=1 Tax=Elysia marginata TaxID=1093978 RepID=A0AAV4JXJ3_9GAST|nr:ankyrin repeat and SAM domain-containing protein 1A [Elysia marginata]
MHMVYEWLRGCSLDYYFISFVQSELTDLQKISQLQLPNEDLYDELEIVLPGHRKRLERAVKKLKLEQMRTEAAEVPVTFGWWGKPECLLQAKFDFLCVRAFLFSSRDSKNHAAVDFMVDSGSDVSTVQESILEGLSLDLIGPVYSCGVHGGNHCNLYRARLAVGEFEMDIEVMGSNYNSLGSRVVRHFRHVIDGHRHIWLKGNYQDPLPAILPLQTPQVSLPSGVKALPAPFDKIQKTQVNHTQSSQDSTHNFNAPLKNQKISTNRPSGPSNSKEYETEDGISAEVQLTQGRKSVGSASSSLSYDITNLSKETGIAEIHNINEKISSPDLNHSKSASNGLHSSHQLEKSTFESSSSTLSNSVKDVQSIQKAKMQKLPPICDEITEPCNRMKAEPLLKDETVNQRMCLGNVVPANLRDTDDDVDHHGIPQRQSNRNLEPNTASTLEEPENKFSLTSLNRAKNSDTDIISIKLSDDLFSSKNKKLLHHSDMALPTDNFSLEDSNSLAFTNNFVQANSEVVLLTLDDLDTSDLSSPLAVHTGSCHQDHDTLCEAQQIDLPLPSVAEEHKPSPSKRLKLDNT